ncbi:MAG: phosphate ABC transporter ATP-binding protein [Desulfobacteraceae bacterium]|nr:phosphate ABC transporter ATP-binding protein [Desulfobacteraceae bacterium]
MNPNTDCKIRLTDLSFYYGPRRILDRINASFSEHALTTIIGPSGQGKSTLLTILNRLWEEIGGGRIQGKVEIRLDGHMVDIYRDLHPLDRLRRKVGMVFQEPNPLPMSIYKNVAFPLKLIGATKDWHAVEAKVQSALSQTFLWNEVKDRLHHDARTLSGGQQQRLCIARALMAQPEVLLLDEPTASLDARAAEVIEELLTRLKSTCTLIMVSHYLEQVRRVADQVMELTHGRLNHQ